jgi:hypothetical protein
MIGLSASSSRVGELITNLLSAGRWREGSRFVYTGLDPPLKTIARHIAASGHTQELCFCILLCD